MRRLGVPKAPLASDRSSPSVILSKLILAHGADVAGVETDAAIRDVVQPALVVSVSGRSPLRTAPVDPAGSL